MPLIRPEVQQILREAGLLEDKRKSSQDQGTVQDRLDAAGLSLDETLEELAITLKSSGNESLRVRVLETILKAHGALKETAAPPPTFIINIQPSSSPTLTEPQKLPEGTNPILLPRQLLNTLSPSPSLNSNPNPTSNKPS